MYILVLTVLSPFNLIRLGPEESSPNGKPPLGFCKGDMLRYKPNYISFAFDTDDGMSVGPECCLRITADGLDMHAALLWVRVMGALQVLQKRPPMRNKHQPAIRK